MSLSTFWHLGTSSHDDVCVHCQPYRGFVLLVQGYAEGAVICLLHFEVVVEVLHDDIFCGVHDSQKGIVKNLCWVLKLLGLHLLDRDRARDRFEVLLEAPREGWDCVVFHIL